MGFITILCICFWLVSNHGQVNLRMTKSSSMVSPNPNLWAANGVYFIPHQVWQCDGHPLSVQISALQGSLWLPKEPKSPSGSYLTSPKLHLNMGLQAKPLPTVSWNKVGELWWFISNYQVLCGFAIDCGSNSSGHPCLFPLTHESLLLNRGGWNTNGGCNVSVIIMGRDGSEAYYCLFYRIIPMFQPVFRVQPHLLKYLDGLFPVFPSYESPKKTLYMSSSSRIEGSRHAKGSSRCHFFGSSLHLINVEKKTSLLEMSDAEVISSCEAAGDWQIALALLHQMIAMSLRQDAYSYSAVMNTVARFLLLRFGAAGYYLESLHNGSDLELRSGFDQLGWSQVRRLRFLCVTPLRTNDHQGP